MSRFKSAASWPASSVLSVALAVFALTVASVLAWSHNAMSEISSNNRTTANIDNNDDDDDESKGGIRIACVGNSIQYFNDCPRLLERMFQERKENDDHGDMSQDSCLRGGASLAYLWSKGNGMGNRFATPNALLPDGTYDIGAATVQDLLDDASFDYVILNDHTQSPARKETRSETLHTFRHDYLPLLLKSNITPILIQTAAYRVPKIRNTEDLGNFKSYTRLLRQGLKIYEKHINTMLQEDESDIQARIAPVGEAYSELYHSNRSLWEQLYHTDHFHPSPHGTLLQAFVLFATITGEKPPKNYDPSWWDRARRMQPPDEPPLPLPTKEDAKILRQVAVKVCDLSDRLIE